MRKLIICLMFFLLSKNLADPQMPNYSFWSKLQYQPDQRLYLLLVNNLPTKSNDIELISQYFKIFRYRFPNYSAIIPLGHPNDLTDYQSFSQEIFLLPLASGNLDKYLKTSHIFSIIGSNLINIASKDTLIAENILPYYQVLAQNLTLTIFSVLPFGDQTPTFAGVHYLDPVLALIKHQQELQALQQKGNFHVVIFQGNHQCQQVSNEKLICPSGADPLANFAKRLAPRSIDLIITRGPFHFIGKVENIPLVMVDQSKHQISSVSIELQPPHKLEFHLPVHLCRHVDPTSGACREEEGPNGISANYLGFSIK